MTGVIIDQRIFEILLSEKLEDLSSHLEENNCKAESYFTQWFV